MCRSAFLTAFLVGSVCAAGSSIMPASRLDSSQMRAITGGLCFAMHTQSCEGEVEGCSSKECFWQEMTAETAEGWKCSAEGQNILLKKDSYDTAIPANPGDSGRENVEPNGTYFCQKSELCTNLNMCPPVLGLCCETYTVPFTEPPITVEICLPCTKRYCNSQITNLNGGDERSVYVLDEEAPICPVPGPNPTTNTQLEP